MRTARTYRALLRAYPPRFRSEYAEPMVQAFADRRRHDGPRRAWIVAVRDLSVTAPRERWETVMHATTSTKLTAAAIVTAVAAMSFILVGGALVGLALLLVLAWELFRILRSRGDTGSGLRGWKVALSGAAVFAVIFVVFALPWPEAWRSAVDDEVAWIAVMVGVCTSIVLVVTGAALGVARWATQRGGRGAI